MPEGANNWQHALQQSREREKIAQDKADAAEKIIRENETKKREEERADMSEAERYKLIATEESEKRARLELRLTIDGAMQGHNVPAVLKEELYRIPWELIPAVRNEVSTSGDNVSWDDVIASVQKHLPDYLSSFKVGDAGATLETKEEPSTERVDSERSLGDDTVVRGHIYTREEVERLSKDPKEYEKHRERILAQMSANGGAL